MPPRLSYYECQPDQTGLVGRVTLAIEHEHGEATIDIRLTQPLAGDTPSETAIRRELEMLRAAIDHILSTPGAISRLHPDTT
jgi:hypothetical protein